MGLLWSRPRTDYEKILLDLTGRIVEIEGRVGELRKKQRSWSFWILSYGALVYILFGLWVFCYPRGPPAISYRPLLDALGLLGGPFAIYYSRRISFWLYGRRIYHYDSRLRKYRTQQKLKVEELKKITAYYKTKGLIERFDLEEDDGKVKMNGIIRQNSSDLVSSKMRLPSLPSLVSSRLASSSPPPSSPPPPIPTPHTWMDRLVDAIIGDDRNTRYALICQKCFSHNGLASHLNLSRQNLVENDNGHMIVLENDSDVGAKGSSDVGILQSFPSSSIDTVATTIVDDITPKQSGKKPATTISRRRSQRHRQSSPLEEEESNHHR